MLGAVVEVLVQVVGQAIADAFGTAASDKIVARAGTRQERSRERLLATVDLLVLAACHDQVVTPAEREELARRLSPLLAAAGLEIELEELIDRWRTRRAALSERELRREVARLAAALPDGERRRAFDAVVELVSADRAGRPPRSASPFRAGAQLAGDATIRLFGEELAIEPAVITEAADRHAP